MEFPTVVTAESAKPTMARIRKNVGSSMLEVGFAGLSALLFGEDDVDHSNWSSMVDQ